jgi:hypothetical protein
MSNVPVTVRCDAEVLERVRELARQSRRTLSQEFMVLLELGLQSVNMIERTESPPADWAKPL